MSIYGLSKRVQALQKLVHKSYHHHIAIMIVDDMTMPLQGNHSKHDPPLIIEGSGINDTIKP